MALPKPLTRTRSLSRQGDTTVVEVEVQSPSMLPEQSARTRARARALLATGVVPATVATIGDVAMGDLNRFTKVIRSRPSGGPGMLVETTVYTVEVNRK